MVSAAVRELDITPKERPDLEAVKKGLPDEQVYSEVTDNLESLVAALSIQDTSFPPYWSRGRDRWLRDLMRSNDFASSSIWNVVSMLGSINFDIVPRNRAVEAHNQAAEDYSLIWRYSWDLAKSQFIQDLMSQDNGAFLEILDAPGQRRISPEKPRETFGGVKYLDSSRCQRTSNPEYPVVYHHTDGKLYKLHSTRVITLAQMPSGNPRLRGVGLCALSRSMRNMQMLTDIAILYQEFMGSRPPNQILFSPGIEPENVKQAFKLAAERDANDGLQRFSRMVFVGTKPGSAADLKAIMLRLLPDGFNKKTEVELAVNLIAMAFGIDARELFPATVSGATKADAEVQDRKTRGKLPAWYIMSMIFILETQILPPQLMAVSESLTDDQVDERRSTIFEANSNAIRSDLDAALTDIRGARIRQLEISQISEEEFERLELQDGRLPDGNDVLTLFYSKEAAYQQLLTLPGIADPLDFEANDAEATIRLIDAQMREVLKLQVQSGRTNQRLVASECYAALRALRAKYDEILNPLPIPSEEPEPASDEEDQDGDQNEPATEQEEGKGRRVKNISRYERGVRAAARGYWSGDLTYSEFIDTMTDTITAGFNRAFAEGAKQFGMMPDDYTEEEQEWLVNRIAKEIGYLDSFADFIWDNRKANGGKLGTVYVRAQMWVNTYNSVKNNAVSMVGKDEKGIWLLGKTEKHCDDCLKYAGRVYRMSIWGKYGILPQNRSLQCGGYRCDCRLERTTQRVTPGFPPAMTGKDRKLDIERWIELTKVPIEAAD